MMVVLGLINDGSCLTQQVADLSLRLVGASCSSVGWLMTSLFVKQDLQMFSGRVVVAKRLQVSHTRENCYLLSHIARIVSTSLRQILWRLEADSVNAFRLTKREADSGDSSR